MTEEIEEAETEIITIKGTDYTVLKEVPFPAAVSIVEYFLTMATDNPIDFKDLCKDIVMEMVINPKVDLSNISKLPMEFAMLAGKAFVQISQNEQFLNMMN